MAARRLGGFSVHICSSSHGLVASWLGLGLGGLGLGLGLGAAAAEAAAACAPKGVAAATRLQYMIDCGSGWTRVERFAVRGAARPQGGQVHLQSSGRLKCAPLAEALAQGEPSQRAWLDALADAVATADATEEDGTGGAAPIFIGGTGGVRDAIQSGAVGAAELAGFDALVSERFGSRARFEVVKGPTEAAHELAAVRYCVAEALALQTATAGGGGGGAQIDVSSVALMSSGGMSSQLVYADRDRGWASWLGIGGGDELRCVSIAHGAKKANALCLRVGVEQGLEQFDMELQALIRAEPVPPPKSSTHLLTSIAVIAAPNVAARHHGASVLGRSFAARRSRGRSSGSRCSGRWPRGLGWRAGCFRSPTRRRRLRATSRASRCAWRTRRLRRWRDGHGRT